MILIKTVEINEKSQENQGGVLTNLISSQLLSALDYQNWFLINAKTILCLIKDQILK